MWEAISEKKHHSLKGYGVSLFVDVTLLEGSEQKKLLTAGDDAEAKDFAMKRVLLFSPIKKKPKGFGFSWNLSIES